MNESLEQRIRRNAFRFKRPALLKLADEVGTIREVETTTPPLRKQQRPKGVLDADHNGVPLI